MKKLAIGLLLSLVSVSAFANNNNHRLDFKALNSEQETLELCKNYADTLNKNMRHNVKSAFDVLRPYANIPKIEIDNLEYQTTQSIKSFEEKIGDYIETVHIDSKKFANNHFMQHRFLLKQDTNAWGATCTFYKPKNQWQLYAFDYYGNPFLFNE